MSVAGILREKADAARDEAAMLATVEVPENGGAIATRTVLRDALTAHRAALVREEVILLRAVVGCLEEGADG